MWGERINDLLAERYRVRQEIGHNGFRVYLAEDLRHRREVGIWVTRHDSLRDRAEPFLRELARTSQLDHPHIVPILESGLADEFLYYVMPHVRDPSLRDRLSTEKQLPLTDALEIARQVADALGYAHDRGFMHGDVNPHDILLVAGRARLAGWNARALTISRGTKHGVVIGMLDYMSPERATGVAGDDRRSDVYSLACVLYEMLAGRPPLVAADRRGLLGKIVSEPPMRIRVLRPDAPAAVDAALDRALAKRADDRFATALEFASVLTT